MAHGRVGCFGTMTSSSKIVSHPRGTSATTFDKNYLPIVVANEGAEHLPACEFCGLYVLLRTRTCFQAKAPKAEVVVGTQNGSAWISPVGQQG